MRSHFRDDRGTVSAEFAIALPAVALVLGAALASVMLAGASIRLQSSSNDAARMLGRGESMSAVTRRVHLDFARGVVTERTRDGVVCATVSARAKVAFIGVPLSAHGCALDER